MALIRKPKFYLPLFRTNVVKRGWLVDNQQQFFSIAHAFELSVKTLSSSSIPSDAEFVANMPKSFKLASQINQLDRHTIKPLRSLGEHAGELSDFLALQSKKIDLMMSYILTLDEGSKARNQGTSFGGSNITFINQSSIANDTLLELKLFIEECNSAIYAIGKVIDTQPCDDGMVINVEFVKIDEEDQEQLVRNSLHIQTIQLKQRSDARKPDNDE